MKNFILSKWNFTGIIILAVLLMGAIVPKSFLIPGISTPTAVAPYFNGIFSAAIPSSGSDSWQVVNAYPNLTFIDPMAMVQLPDESGFLVASKQGRIWQISNDTTTTIKTLFLDFSTEVNSVGQAGFTNFALHPDFGDPSSPNNGYFYVWYHHHPTGATSCHDDAFLRLSRFRVPVGSTIADPNSELVMIQQYDRHCIHHGGGIFFGSDGFLYLSIGDEGYSFDHFDVAQKINDRLYSGMIRIDVNQDPIKSHPIRRQPVDPSDHDSSLPNSFTQGYYIPNDNPWQDLNGGILEEFYAIGLRNPHRATYDFVDNKIWTGDIGQDQREEINVIEKAGNYQWPYMEGNVAGTKPMPTTLIGTEKPPIYDYERSVGTCIIGGFVYRGSKFPSLYGKYLYGDYETFHISSLEPSTTQVDYLASVTPSTEGIGISSFGTDAEGEIYMLRLENVNIDGGVILKLHKGNPVPDPSTLLSQTGLFTDMSTLTPDPVLVPYKVNTPLWSDRAEKQRWIILPNDGVHDMPNEQITFNATSEWQFPEGTVFVKHFELPLDENTPAITTRLETRVFVIAANDMAYGLTYKWNTAQTDAELLTTSEINTFNITALDGSTYTQTWEYPSRTACMTCHNTNAGHVLGVKTWQLNGDYLYPSGITDNQLNTWNHLAMFDVSLQSSDISTYLQSKYINDSSASLEERVRSYIDANCSHCHRPNGVDGAFDARFSTPLSQQNIICEVGISRNTPLGDFIMKPSEVEDSHLFIRDNSIGANKMPPLAKNLLDDDYIQVLSDWISSMDRVQVALETKVFLQSNYNIATATMSDELRVASLIPMQDPYLGTHTITDSSVFDDKGNDSIVDWVLLELRDATDASKILARMPALLQRDGDVTDIDGSSIVTFDCVTSGNYYVAVRHRNHLGIMTNNAIFIDNS